MVHLALLVMMLNFDMEQRMGHTIDSLRKQGVDTFMIFESGADGYIAPPCECCAELPQYLCYLQRGKYFIKRIRLCGEDASIELPAKNPLSFYLVHIEKLRTETIKEPECTNDYLPAYYSHYAYFYMTMITGSQRVKSAVNTTYLNYKGDPGGCKNIHYKHNQQLKTKILIDLWEKTITKNGTISIYDAFFKNSASTN